MVTVTRRVFLATAGLVLMGRPFSGPALKGETKADLLAQRITYQESGHKFEITLGNLARQCQIPMGIDMETATTDKAVSIDIANGTVADALNAILAQEPAYKWSEVDGVINVEPRQNPNSILDVRISEFRVRHADEGAVHRALVSLPEIQKWLSDNHLVERTVLSVDIMFGKDKPRFPEISLSMRGATLRTILNRIVRLRGFDGWNVARWGDRGEYLSLGFSSTTL